ncbi:hypothetical protein [Fodinibius salsisoli]|uniref:DUF4429 domain-containing protein n=1 Tax=Fodinibius salsisoli TaxID=2820877 RepID=A0ABT3PJB1_9BACT|nr:hypothetical protein [Fodinibius salsisoli]MCW9706025.1 hypothetical protein [Fodinibius salsisoli]
MNISNRTVPFEITGVSHGLKEVEGLIKLTNDGFELEYQLKDSFVGMIKSDSKTTIIPYSNLEEITFEKGWFSNKIILEGTSMDAFNDLPGTEPGSRTLKIKRKDKEEAEKLVSRARMEFSEYKLNQMGGE